MSLIKTKRVKEGILIGSCNGNETLLKSFDLVDPDFLKIKKNNLVPATTAPVLLKIDEIIEGEGTFREIFQFISGDIGSASLTEGQISMFLNRSNMMCLNKHSETGLRECGHGTLFLLFQGGEFFVVVVRAFSENKTRGLIYSLDNKSFWGVSDECWIVTPQ